MNLEQIDTIKQVISPYLKVKSLKKVDEYTVINRKMAIPIALVSNYYSSNMDIEVKDEDAVYLGSLCFCKSSNNSNVQSFSENKLIAFLAEAENMESIPQEYYFKKDYLVLEEKHYKRYKKQYYMSAPIWGHFSHEFTIANPVHTTVNSIVAKMKVEIPTKYHEENCIRALIEPYSFERFLKWYHLLELLFDYEFVQNVKRLDENIKGIGQLLSAYKGDDLSRLRHIISTRCQNIEAIEKSINNIHNHLDKAKEIFFDYGKDSNPIKSFENLKEIMDTGGFTYEEQKKRVRNYTEEMHKQHLIKLTSYWIYRIRCCIAHNKIGEYILSNGDEYFMADFAEPLIGNVLKEVFVST